MIKIMQYVFATCGGLGFFPYAPGTVTSLVAGLLFWLCRHHNILLMAGITLVLSVLGVIAAHQVAWHEQRKDPRIVVIDEWVGMWTALLLTGVFVNICFSTISFYFFLFLLFRFFDIAKPLGIKKMEKFSGGWGIMLDDVLAACYAVVTMMILSYFIF